MQYRAFLKIRPRRRRPTLLGIHTQMVPKGRGISCNTLLLVHQNFGYELEYQTDIIFILVSNLQ